MALTSAAAAARAPSRSPERDEAFERWYTDYHDRLHKYCSRLLGDEAAGEDVAQETLFRAWLARDQLRSEPEVRAWLWRVARNLSVDAIRQRKRLEPRESLPDAPATDPEPWVPVIEMEEHRAVRTAMAGLNRRDREALQLREVSGLGYGELASRLGISEVGARSVLFRARRSLREALEAAGGLFSGVAPLPVGRKVWTEFRRFFAGMPAGSSAPGRLTMELAAGAVAAATMFGGGQPAADPGQRPAEQSQADANAPRDPAAGIDPSVVSIPDAGQVGTPSAPVDPNAPDVGDPQKQFKTLGVTFNGGKAEGEKPLLDAKVSVPQQNLVPQLNRVLEKIPSIQLGKPKTASSGS